MGLGVGLPLLVFRRAVRVGGGEAIGDEGGRDTDLGGQGPAIIAFTTGLQHAVHRIGAIGGVMQEFGGGVDLRGVADDADEFDLIAANVERVG